MKAKNVKRVHIKSKNKTWISMITKKDVENAQEKWGDLIVWLGTLKGRRKELEEEAEKAVDEFYAYDMGTVLFKPTLAAENQFRLTKEGALSYFIGGNSKFPEDSGFAIKPWTKVTFENAGIISNSNTATAMGNYFFTEKGSGNITKVEYTFGYVKNSDGDLKINVHHSSLPYSPGE